MTNESKIEVEVSKKTGLIVLTHRNDTLSRYEVIVLDEQEVERVMNAARFAKKLNKSDDYCYDAADRYTKF